MKAHSPTDESPTSSRISIIEIAQRLQVGRLAVYSMLERGIIPGIRVGHRWIVTRHAYMNWERTCGSDPSGIHPGPDTGGPTN
jgi:excisionase family DNA binding protein